MNITRRRRALLAALAALLAADGAVAQGADVFTLGSAAFKDGERIPTRMAGNNRKSPNCVGDNVSPPLAWAHPPVGTKSYALVLFDPEARPPDGFVHWVAYGIPVAVSGFAEGEVSKPGDKYVGGKSSAGLPHYFGPCTPPGAPHHYTFTLFATDLEPGALQPGLTRDELLKALQGHAKAATGLIGTFSNP